jgi:D-serine dehydratase
MQKVKQFVLDGSQRGYPADLASVAASEIGSLGLNPRDGSAQLPVLTFDRSAWNRNCDAMFAYCAAVGARIAPHAKTPMSPELAKELMDPGAVAMTVADIRQAAVMLEHGIDHLLLANQIGGTASGARLGRLLAQYPSAKLTLYVDSVAALETAAAVADAAGRRLDFLIEVGGGRAGARGLDVVRAIFVRLSDLPNLRASGIAAYEGASVTADATATRRDIAAVHALASEAFALLRSRQPGERLILSSGGSSFFDLVLDDLGPVAQADGNCDILLRSGAIFFSDHGIYAKRLLDMDHRSGFEPARLGAASNAFVPALVVHAEVLSRPEPGLVICGMGMRDVSFDQGLPVPIAGWRAGRDLALPQDVAVTKLNDQHAFLKLPAEADLAVGDVVSFGISHPCTALDRWSWMLETAPDGKIIGALRTHFG